MVHERQVATRVLIIDSDPLARNVLETAVRTLGGFEVWTASDGETGFRVVQTFRPHCVLVNLLVPGLDGFTLLARMRHSGWRPDNVIVSNGVMDSGMGTDLRTLGVDTVLPIPFRLDDLEVALGRRRNETARRIVAHLT